MDALRDRCPAFHKSVNFSNIFSVVAWDAAHWLNLAVNDVRMKSAGSKTLTRFFDRTNKFAGMFGHGRGVAEFQAAADQLEGTSRVVSHYSMTR